MIITLYEIKSFYHLSKLVSHLITHGLSIDGGKVMANIVIPN